MPKIKLGPNRGTKHSSLDSSPLGYNRWIVPVLVIAAIVLLVIGIGSTVNKPKPAATAAATPTATAEPCAVEAVRPDVEKVHALMLEFYDASALASQTPINQLVEVIPSLQEIRRRAEALDVSGCLDLLRSYQLSHMNMVINTLMAFMANSDQALLMEGIVQARLLNEEYKKEKARLLDEPYVPPATRAPQPTATGTAATGTVTVLVTPTP